MFSKKARAKKVRWFTPAFAEENRRFFGAADCGF
jgi:hypothetical protein